ncbi:hypothetical protein QRD43_11120 [Pelomonas sp. APW6]|uniref:DUF3617 domain-containing protein n=1 Tax=Roseateles subflavus TaxID=3053353 RepID=A0ABT7LHV8_9BURK|nr:hypothetical protein [Pelomonas sp. APW6]MDL5032452.1 hypothetical protein [Pelomonas sp. APW6]
MNARCSFPALRPLSSRLMAALALPAALLLAPAAMAQSDKPARGASSSGFSAGVEFRAQATPADVGLPAYPGAVPQFDKKDDAASLTMGLWGGTFGFKLVVTKFATDDSLETVSRFYKDALGKYGPVLDCSQNTGGTKKDEKILSCDDDKPEKGGLLFKAGKPEAYRLVSLQQRGSKVHFQLVRIEGPKR